MTKIDLSVAILAGLALVGTILLISIDKSTEVIIPILTVLVGYLIGKKSPQIARFFKKTESKSE